MVIESFRGPTAAGSLSEHRWRHCSAAGAAAFRVQPPLVIILKCLLKGNGPCLESFQVPKLYNEPCLKIENHSKVWIYPLNQLAFNSTQTWAHGHVAVCCCW